MKKTLGLASLLLAVFLLTGCATIYPVGSLYSGVKLPVNATSNSSYSKVGKASCISVLTLIAAGDASIEAASKDGGITKIHHVDWETKNILGIIGTYTTTVYGD